MQDIHQKVKKLLIKLKEQRGEFPPAIHFKHLQILKTIKQKIKYDNSSILQQSKIYSDEYRVLMEYIDNSIDAAECYYSNITNSYSYGIKIQIIKSGSARKTQEIQITDNCSGMNTYKNKPLTIFRSEKRNDAGTNGMFGFGLFSCFSLCNSLSITTMKSNSSTECSFTLTPETFTNSKSDDIEFDIFEKTISSKSDRWHGTVVKLSSFNEGMFQEINLEKLRTEIESHFELILIRGNLVIELIDELGTTINCRPFNYREYSSNPFQKTLTTLTQTNSKKYKTDISIPIDKTPVKIFLIAARDIDLNRLPFFIIKGRRITEIAKVDQFRTTKKSAIWSRPNITGYIDVTGILQPTPTRKDFIKTDLSKALFNSLIKIEGEIKEYIDEESELNLNSKFNDFENKINSALNSFFTKTSENDPFRKFTPGYNEYTLMGYRTVERKSGVSPKLRSVKKSSYIRVKKERERNHKFTLRFPNNSPDDSSNAGRISVKIDYTNEPHKNIDGKFLRSILIDSTVIIFRNHEEFMNRITNSRKGFIEINSRIIQYISMEIITHLINNRDQEDSDIIGSYKDFVSSVLKLEAELKDLIGERF